MTLLDLSFSMIGLEANEDLQLLPDFLCDLHELTQINLILANILSWDLDCFDGFPHLTTVEAEFSKIDEWFPPSLMAATELVFLSYGKISRLLRLFKFFGKFGSLALSRLLRFE